LAAVGSHVVQFPTLKLRQKRELRMTDPSHSNCFSYFEKGNLSIA
jgi:hypothetical protein